MGCGGKRWEVIIYKCPVESAVKSGGGGVKFIGIKKQGLSLKPPKRNFPVFFHL